VAIDKSPDTARTSLIYHHAYTRSDDLIPAEPWILLKEAVALVGKVLAHVVHNPREIASGIAEVVTQF
jgi:hypothetical protein